MTCLDDLSSLDLSSLDLSSLDLSISRRVPPVPTYIDETLLILLF
jgi:hypothetical protein